MDRNQDRDQRNRIYIDNSKLSIVSLLNIDTSPVLPAQQLFSYD
jgi:hypothetical protein